MGNYLASAIAIATRSDLDLDRTAMADATVLLKRLGLTS
jgi:hypothetical protein